MNPQKSLKDLKFPCEPSSQQPSSQLPQALPQGRNNRGGGVIKQDIVQEILSHECLFIFISQRLLSLVTDMIDKDRH